MPKLYEREHACFFSVIKVVSARRGIGELRNAETSKIHAFGSKEIKNMLGIIAAVLIVLWLLGFFAFHVTTAFVHVALIVGIILLVMHFLRRTAST
jgi:Na+/H+ antiporter NhaC